MLQIERILSQNERATRSGAPVSLLASHNEVPSEAVRALQRFDSAYAKQTARTVEALARHPTLPVLLEGEIGTGKRLISRAIHDLSGRRHGPYERVDLANTTPSVAEVMLFGNMKGAFTDAKDETVGAFPRAHRGTIELDEITKAPLELVQRLLGAIEYGEVRPMGCARWFHVDARAIACTNLDVSVEVERGTFLRDLYSRILGGRMQLQPLRRRRGEIPDLMADYVRAAARACGMRRVPQVSDELMSACLKHSWPMNLRELSITMHRAVAEAGGEPTLRLSHVPSVLPLGAFKKRRRHVSDAELREAYKRFGSDVEATARLLGISPSTVYRRRGKLDQE